MILAFVVAALSGLQPDPLDAVAAAPENHVVILENDRVRVLRVTVQPGETEAPHVHRWSSVMHIQSAQPLVDILYRGARTALPRSGARPYRLDRRPRRYGFRRKGRTPSITPATAYSAPFG